jgi:hypothetical protein
VKLEHGGGLVEEREPLRVVALQGVEPVVLVGRVGVAEDGGAGAVDATLRLRWVAPDTRRRGIEYLLGNLAQFVEPDDAALPGQQLLHVFHPI